MRTPKLELLAATLLLCPLSQAQLPIQRAIDSPADSIGFGVAGAALGDVDGDGVPDHAIAETAFLPLPNPDTVHIFSGATGALLKSFVEEADGDHFAAALAAVGDLDGDGVPDLLVGAPRHDAGFNATGRATVLSGATGAVLLAFNGTDKDQFLGEALASAGDVDGDGKADLLIASPGEDALPSRGGIVRLFRGSDGAQLFQWGNGASTADFAESYGAAVTGAGDLDGDGVRDVLIGAHSRLFSPNGRTGAVEARSGADGTLLFELRDVASPVHGQAFGRALAGGTDLTGDGVPELLIGAPGDSETGVRLGAVFVYDGATQALLAKHLGKASAPGELGDHVAFVGDVNGDGFQDYASASEYAGAAGNSGYVHVWSGADHSLLTDLQTTAKGFGACLVPLGDVTGDRMPDLLVGAPQEHVAQVLTTAGARPYGDLPSEPVQTMAFSWIPSAGADPARGSFEISGAAPGAVGAFGIAGAASALDFFGATILVDLTDPGFALIPIAFDATGRYLSPETTLRQPALDGLSIFCQGIVFNAGPLPGFTTSTGLEVLLTD